jgi:hypothetical protein
MLGHLGAHRTAPRAIRCLNSIRGLFFLACAHRSARFSPQGSTARCPSSPLTSRRDPRSSRSHDASIASSIEMPFLGLTCLAKWRNRASIIRTVVSSIAPLVSPSVIASLSARSAGRALGHRRALFRRLVALFNPLHRRRPRPECPKEAFLLVLHRALPDLQRMKPGRGSVCGPVGASEFLVRNKPVSVEPLAKLSGGCDRAACWGHCMR